MDAGQYRTCYEQLGIQQEPYLSQGAAAMALNAKT
ncbi:Ankyrin repeat protein [Giardia duodenalis assemblage B]|uniref:Ankyrin repeat protein n=1 Tax=Giardia duodenalis assemblage B TaxID=1394984 RepID=A0A132NPP3_GIAIN|nr:Ankyrin repeat protein [Giardia intestinalis assemblage B]